jgi:CRP-like cAMP-binding protein
VARSTSAGVPEDDRGILRNLGIFSRVGDRALEAAARRTVVRRVKAGTILFRRGEPCEGLYVVLEGSVRVYRASPDGREQVLHLHGEGQPLAEVPLMDGGPYPASARAEEDSRVLFLPRGDFEWLYQNSPEIADSVIRELGRRLRRMVRLVEKISLRDVPARVAMTLLEYAELNGPVRDGTQLLLPRTQDELAAELATTRESVARALSSFRKAGAIESRGRRIRILDAALLESIAFSGRTRP